MHWADIMAALHKANSSAAAIAEELGVTRVTVSAVIRGSRTSHNVAYAIAAATGIPTEKMWPGRYLTPEAYREARGDNKSGRLPGRKEVAHG